MSDDHVTLIWLATVGDNLQSEVMLTGLGGRLGSTPGLLVGIGFGKVTSLLFTLTERLDGKLSSCSHDVSKRQNLI